MKKLLSLLAIFVLVFTVGCTQTTTTPTDEMTDEAMEGSNLSTSEMEQLVDAIPEDYVGVWLRTGTYVDGIPESHEPAIWTLNSNNYTSTGTCINTGEVRRDSPTQITITLDSTTCPNVPTGLVIPYTYEINFDKDRDVEVMTVYTGPMTETYDRQS